MALGSTSYPDLDILSIPVYYEDCAANPNSKSLIIALTSHGGSGIHFEFYEVLRQYNKAHMLLFSTQFRNGYYIDKGLSDLYPDLISVTNMINEIISLKGISTLVFLGEGSAGTGAIFYGWEMAKVIDTSILTFAPYNSIPTENWNLVNDVCVVHPLPAHKKLFKIYHESAWVQEANRSLGLSTYFDVEDIEGHSHLAKASYLRGDLFTYLDAAIDPADNVTIAYPGFRQDIWTVRRLTLHQEEMDQGITLDYINWCLDYPGEDPSTYPGPGGWTPTSP